MSNKGFKREMEIIENEIYRYQHCNQDIMQTLLNIEATCESGIALVQAERARIMDLEDEELN